MRTEQLPLANQNVLDVNKKFLPLLTVSFY